VQKRIPKPKLPKARSRKTPRRIECGAYSWSILTSGASVKIVSRDARVIAAGDTLNLEVLEPAAVLARIRM
jgi:hypothetical protein